KRLNVSRNLPISIIMSDINGLKLTNDAFGHAAGDALLRRVAKILRTECRMDDIIARMGGDEFVILLPRTEAGQTAEMVQRIQWAIQAENIKGNHIRRYPFVISLSFGWDTKSSEDEDINAVFKRAEDHMYRNKLEESSLMRIETLKLIMNTLHEKDEREELNAYKIGQICEAIGQELNLSVESIRELQTLSSIHDIGKVILDSAILNREGKLTEQEWVEVKRHSETGYRILESMKEFSQLADIVLAHHERWDGDGYPKGLKGYEIPLAARIIALADSYIAMTGLRQYRKTLSKEEAKEEISNNAGTQFDPELARLFTEKIWDKI
ncbi:MAG: diguanylate cyclase, partial [Peptococcaceae bacterium]|nr:diguanylate cyclase [Peptococcaceae bacterium]